MDSVAVIGAALDLGAGRRGVDMGPSAIRYAGLAERLAELGLEASREGISGSAQGRLGLLSCNRAQTARLRGEVAQLVEHTAENRGVAGSIPALAITPSRFRL